MVEISTPVGDNINVNRTGRHRSPDYRLVVQFYKVGEREKPRDERSVYESDTYLSGYVESRIRGRSDVTASVIQEALDNWYENIMEKRDDLEIAEIRNVKVMENHTIRQRPYEEWTEKDDGDE